MGQTIKRVIGIFRDIAISVRHRLRLARRCVAGQAIALLKLRWVASRIRPHLRAIERRAAAAIVSGPGFDDFCWPAKNVIDYAGFTPLPVHGDDGTMANIIISIGCKIVRVGLGLQAERGVINTRGDYRTKVAKRGPSQFLPYAYCSIFMIV